MARLIFFCCRMQGNVQIEMNWKIDPHFDPYDSELILNRLKYVYLSEESSSNIISVITFWLKWDFLNYVLCFAVKIHV